MTKLILWRIAQLPLILAIIYLVTFLLAWVVPGSPFDGEKNISDHAKLALKEKFHADTPTGFLTYYPYRIVTQGDFGPSMHYKGQFVNEIIGRSLPVSVQLGMVALAIAVIVGTVVGTLAAVWRGGWLDWASLSISLIGISLPSFVVAAFLLLVFGFWLRWANVGWGTPDKVVLPALALSLAPMAYISRLTRVSMLDVLGADFVRTARAKGCSRPKVVFKHCLRNAFLPVFSYLGPAAAATLTGSFVVERVFNIPGLGQFFVESVLNRDQTLILGVVMVYSALLLTFNLLVDLGYGLIDPRIDLTAKQ
jgi:oligopeptide transport system permease protein